ncbi:ABC transporter E family member 2 [Pelomyxa schiedti]|nr:ABC transporter E family member 2 [Pelomyxa schiedti]
MASAKGGRKEHEGLTRIAIVNTDKCKPKRCRQECKKTCPVVRMGKLCIEVAPSSKIAWISEELCIGCGICVKKCPFGAINIINLPRNLSSQTTHRYGPNTFKLHRLPVPRAGQVLGLVGTNGIGKSTALKILAAKLKPNLGRYDSPPDWAEILTYFRGSELQSYFTRLLEDNLKALIKPQYVDNIPKAVKGQVGTIIHAKDERHVAETIIHDLELETVLTRDVTELSGGELQRFAIAVTCVQEADVYMFDEPSSYLDVRQRIRAARTIRSLLSPDKYVIVVEHDLSVLDFLSDFICCLYGDQGAYGVVTMPFGVREGINIFLDGFVPTENLRFREDSLKFKIVETATEDEVRKHCRYTYPAMTKTLGTFQLDVQAGDFTDSEIIVFLGQNGTGKTTFIRMLAGLLKADDPTVHVPELNVSYKPQKISPKFTGTVRELLQTKIRDTYLHPQFVSDVTKPLLLDTIIDQNVQNLSGGELQRVAIILALGQPADIYLIDEPSAYLDSEQRIIAAKVIKRFILHSKKTGFIVEHDFIMATYMADRVVVYQGEPSIHCTANTPQSLLSGMNLFLSDLDITFRRDPTNFRPRINNLVSVELLPPSGLGCPRSLKNGVQDRIGGDIGCSLAVPCICMYGCAQVWPLQPGQALVPTDACDTGDWPELGADDWLVSFKIESSTGGVSQSPVLVDIDGVGNYKNFQSNSKWLVLLTERLLLLWVVQSQNSAASLAEVLEVPHNFKLPMDFVFPPSHFASDKIVVASGNGEVSFIDLQASANAHALVNTYIGKLARPDPCKIWWVSGQQGEMQGDLLVVSHKPLEMSGRIMSVFDMYNRTALDLLPSQHWGALASQPTHICANFKSNWCTKAGRDASAPVPIIEVASRRTLGILRVTEPPTPEDEWMWW